MIDTFNINLDRKKLSQHGISVSEVNKSLSEAMSKGSKIPPTPEGLRLLNDCLVKSEIATESGKVHLSEIAEIKIVKTPSHVIWEFLNKASGSVPSNTSGKTAH